MKKIWVPVFLVAVLAGGTLGWVVAYLVMGPGVTSLLGGQATSDGVQGPAELRRFLKQRDQPMSRATPGDVYRSASRNLLWTVGQSLNIPTLRPWLAGTIQGLQYQLDLKFQLEGRSSRSVDFSARFQSRSFANGHAEGELTVEKPSLPSLNQVGYKLAGTRLQILLPEYKEVLNIKGLKQLRRSGNDWNVDVPEIDRSMLGLEEITWQGQPVYRLTASGANTSPPSALYVRSDPPRTVAGMNYSNPTRPSQRARILFHYVDSRRRVRLHELQIADPDGSASGHVRFTYRNDRIDGIKLFAASSSRPVAEFRFEHGKRFARGVKGFFRHQGKLRPLMDLSWAFDNNRLSRLRWRVQLSEDETDVTARMLMKNIRWFRDVQPVSLEIPEGYSEISKKQFQQRVMPLVLDVMSKAMSLRNKKSL